MSGGRAPAPKPARPLQFNQIEPLPLNTPVTTLQIEGGAFDLRQLTQFVGLSYGPGQDDELGGSHAITLGWAATSEVQVQHGGRRALLSGITLTLHNVSRFEISLPRGEAGPLEYIELRHDPEPTLLFFFERGSLRLSGEQLQGEVLLEDNTPSPLVNIQ